MNRRVKKMYEEMILDAIINENWRYEPETDRKYASFQSPKKKVGEYFYSFHHIVVGKFAKSIKVMVGKTSSYNEESDYLTFSIFSPIFWRLTLMYKDKLRNEHLEVLSSYTETYKAYKKNKAEQEIKSLEESIVRLTKLKEEFNEAVKEPSA